MLAPSKRLYLPALPWTLFLQLLIVYQDLGSSVDDRTAADGDVPGTESATVEIVEAADDAVEAEDDTVKDEETHFEV